VDSFLLVSCNSLFALKQCRCHFTGSWVSTHVNISTLTASVALIRGELQWRAAAPRLIAVPFHAPLPNQLKRSSRAQGNTRHHILYERRLNQPIPNRVAQTIQNTGARFKRLPIPPLPPQNCPNLPTVPGPAFHQLKTITMYKAGPICILRRCVVFVRQQRPARAGRRVMTLRIWSNLLPGLPISMSHNERDSDLMHWYQFEWDVRIDRRIRRVTISFPPETFAMQFVMTPSDPRARPDHPGLPHYGDDQGRDRISPKKTA
jgi:hypothetical protein